MDKIEAFRERRDGARRMIEDLNAAHAEHRDPVVIDVVEEEPNEVVVPPEISADDDIPF